MRYALDESPRTKEVNSLFPSYQHPKKDIEADEMVDMRVRDEDVLDAVNLARR